MATSMLKIAGLARQSKCVLSSIAKGVRQNSFAQPACLISTSKKNKDIATGVQPVQSPPKDAETPEEMFPADPNHEKNWISYGYDIFDKEDDRFLHRITMFLFVSLGLIGTSFLFAYMPDHKLVDWSQREAYIELARREKEGLPLIDCELIDPSTIELPSDEELGDFEIIV